MKKKEEPFDWRDVKVGQIIFSISLRRFAGRIWEFNYCRVKIIKINEKSIRINRLDDNDGKGNEWTARKEELKEEACNYGFKPKELLDMSIENVRRYAERAVKNLEGYTTKHPDYSWYEYTAHILTDFANMLKSGYSKEKYEKVKLKYRKFENGQTKKIFS